MRYIYTYTNIHRYINIPISEWFNFTEVDPGSGPGAPPATHGADAFGSGRDRTGTPGARAVAVKEKTGG